MQAIIARHLFSFGFSFLLAFYLIPIIARAAGRFGLVDTPDGKLKQHKQPVPYFGGMAIFIAFISTLGVSYPFENRILWLLLGTTLLLCIGLIDDLKVLKPGQKFFGQFLSVLCLLKGGFSLKTNFFSSPFNMFLSGFWMMSVINAFNLVDVMDGLSSLLAIIATSTFLVIALLFKQYAVSVLLLAFLGPLLAFFWYNKPPARIYLGDTGSLFVGGFLASIPLLLDWSKQFELAYYTPIIILGVPLLEVFFLIIIRSYLGIAPYRGSPHHFSIYLQKKGWSKWRVLMFAGFMSLSLSILALLFLMNFVSLVVLSILLATFLAIWSLFVFLI